MRAQWAQCLCIWQTDTRNRERKCTKNAGILNAKSTLHIHFQLSKRHFASLQKVMDESSATLLPKPHHDHHATHGTNLWEKLWIISSSSSSCVSKPWHNDLMTSSSSNHDFHLQTPLSTTTTTTTTTPPFKTEQRVFAARNLRNVLMMDGWVGPQIPLCLSVSLPLHLQESNNIFIYLFTFFSFRIFLF